MTLSGPQSRRAFLQTMLAGMGAFAAWLMETTIRRSTALPESTTSSVTVPLPAGDAVRFYDEAIVIARNGQVAAFSSVCTHLGCHINRVEGDELVCPCHGSRFNLRGQLTHGPAAHNLRPLAFAIDRADATVVITVKS